MCPFVSVKSPGVLYTCMGFTVKVYNLLRTVTFPIAPTIVYAWYAHTFPYSRMTVVHVKLNNTRRFYYVMRLPLRTLCSLQTLPAHGGSTFPNKTVIRNVQTQ